jgi:hypothetical protein
MDDCKTEVMRMLERSETISRQLELVREELEMLLQRAFELARSMPDGF